MRTADALMSNAVLNQVALLGVVESEPCLRLEKKPFRLNVAVRVPTPAGIPGAQDNLVTIVKEGNLAVDIRPALAESATVLVTGALRSQRTSDGRAVNIWVQAQGIWRADDLRRLPAMDPGTAPIRRLNHVCLLGAVAKEPQIRVTADGHLRMTFLIAVSMPPWTKCAQPNYFKVCRWGHSVRQESTRLVVGTPVVVLGALRSRRGGVNNVEVYALAIQ